MSLRETNRVSDEAISLLNGIATSLYVSHNINAPRNDMSIVKYVRYTFHTMQTIQNIYQICKLVLGFICVISIITSIVISQIYAPSHFSSQGQKKTTLTAFLRASVKLGDSYLIKQVFHNSLVTEYPVVFSSYLKENEWLQRLQAIEARSPQSRDVLAAMSVLYDHAGKESKSKELRAKIVSIDPIYESKDSNH